MYNTELAKISNMKSGNLGIQTPYNGSFVNDLKASVPSARWSAPYWIIKPSGREQAEKLLGKYFPTEETLQKVRIEWELDRDNPTIDGTSLASVSRDYWKWRTDCPIDFKIIEQELESGGSRKSPGLYGKLVIETAIRPDALIEPSAEIQVIEDGETPNPLAEFSTEELLAELKRRGVS